MAQPREVVAGEVFFSRAGSKATSSKTGSSSSCSSDRSSRGRTTSRSSARRIEMSAKAAEEDGSESSGYRVTRQDPGEAAERRGFPVTSQVIGGKVVGALKFRSEGHERKFLEETSQSFCLPLMEEELGQAGTEAIHQSVQDLALKTFVAVRCASRSFRKEVEDLHPYMKSSDCDRVVQLEAANSALAESLQREKELSEAVDRAHDVAISDNKRLQEK